MNAENHEFHRLGHMHRGGKALILENLQVLTGEAEYGRPEIQHMARTGIVVDGICANAMYLLGPVTEMYLNWFVDAWEGRLVPRWLAGFVRSRYTTGLLFAGGCLFSVVLTLAIGLGEAFAAALPDQP